MKVQSVNNNQQNFGIRKITLDDSLIEHASTRVLRAIESAMTPDTYKLGDDLTDIEISAFEQNKLCECGTPHKDYDLTIRFTSELDNKATKSGGIIFTNPKETIKSGLDVVEAIIAVLEHSNPFKMRNKEQILAAARAKAAALNPKD